MPGFRTGDEPGAEAIGHGRAEDEPAALDADDEVDALVHERHREAVDRGAKPAGSCSSVVMS